MAGKLDTYRRKRRLGETPEPAGETAAAEGDRFVVQEHHARRLHWDLRLAHDGVAVSWALPRGVPDDPSQNRLAVHVEDHPIEYMDFEGEIPKGQYGAGTVTIWDSGSYELHKWQDDKVIVTFHGERLEGKYALFRTRGDDWLIHRMDPPADGGEPMPEKIVPMLARLSKLPKDDAGWAFEIKWDGIRALAYVDKGEVRLCNRNLRDVTAQYPELRGLARALGMRRVVLDGEIVALDDAGRPSFERLQARMHLASEAAVRRRMRDTSVSYMVFDLLWLDGRSLTDLPYAERREQLDELDLRGPHWQTPAYHEGDGAALLAASAEQGLEGVVAKRLESPYCPGKRTGHWLKVKNTASQEFVIGGWMPGEGRRATTLGALLVGYYEGDELRYAGKVGTGYTEEMLAKLMTLLRPLERASSPFGGAKAQRGAVFVDPELVAEIEFREWTRDGMLRAPSFKGLREDKDPREVVREVPA